MQVEDGVDRVAGGAMVVCVQDGGRFIVQRLGGFSPLGVQAQPSAIFGRDLHLVLSEVAGLSPDSAEALVALHRLAAQTRESVCVDLPLETAAGRVVHEVILTPVVSPGGQVTHLVCSGRDITRRSEREESLAQSERKYRSLFLEMVSGSALLRLEYDQRGVARDLVFVEVNPAFERLTGLSSSEVCGRRFSECLAAGDVSWIDTLTQVGRTRCPVHLEKHSRRLNRWFEMTAYCPAENTVACTFLDVTGRRRMEREITQAKMDLERANQAKDRFLATLSHELRTPLTPVLAMISSLDADARLPGDVRDDLQMMRRNIELEARLIDDLLDITRIARGKLAIDPRPLDVHQLLREVIAATDRTLGDFGMHIHLDLPDQARVVSADPARLQQVFWNIVKNAVEHAAGGGDLTIRSRDLDGGRVAITFADNGEGIAPEHLPRVFDAFEQGAHRPGSRHGMLGLGLTICRSIIEMHSGQITAHSDGVGRGSTFTVVLPTVTLAPATATPGTPARPPEEAPPVGLTILLVEDHPPTREVLSRILHRMGHHVTSVASKAQAVAAAERSSFDLLISDIGLPDGSGLEVIREIRRPEGLRAIALSGYGMAQDRERSRLAGFAEHLTKPITVSDLRQAIGTLFPGGVSGDPRH